MKIRTGFLACCVGLLWFILPSATLNCGVSEGSQAPVPPAKTPGHPSAGAARPAPSRNNREAIEKESAMSLKEQELKRIAAGIEARRKELDQARKSAETSITAKKEVDKEKYRKMVKLYKALKPAEAARLLDKLDEELALEMLNQMDTKTAAKLIPLLNEKRVLKWTRLSLIKD
jgi:flagellar motility protein MotE (MotC chaperone)